MADEELIRKRKSYTRWFDWTCFLVEVSEGDENGNHRGIMPRDVKKILDKIHLDLDGRNAYGSETNSIASKESLELAYIDYYTPQSAHCGTLFNHTP